MTDPPSFRLYWLSPSSVTGLAFQAMCDFTTLDEFNMTGWTLVAGFSSGTIWFLNQMSNHKGKIDSFIHFYFRLRISNFTFQIVILDYTWPVSWPTTSGVLQGASNSWSSNFGNWNMVKSFPDLLFCYALELNLLLSTIFRISFVFKRLHQFRPQEQML